MGYSGAVMYLCNEHEYYSIDLDRLPEKVSPMTTFSVERMSRWTVIDKCIYCIGGLKEPEKLRGYTAGKTLHKYDTASCTWECIVPNRNLRRHRPYVFAFGRKIYVVGGYLSKYDNDYEFEGEEDKDIQELCYPGEYYHLDSGTWHSLPKLDGIGDFSNYFIAPVMDDDNTIIFYSHDTFLFYHVVEDAWKDQLRARLGVKVGLEESFCVDVLFAITTNLSPVVCNSTFYWFNNDMCLYGFDYVHERWFQSNSLAAQLRWPLSGDRDTFWDVPLLLYLDNQTFVAISAITRTKEVGLAIITVERHSASLKVSLKFSQKIILQTSLTNINLQDGMITICKDEGSTTTNIMMPGEGSTTTNIMMPGEGSMLGKRKSPLEEN